MARVRAFAALRYQQEVVELASVLAPPYDVIGAGLQEELYSRAMQNIVRLELGKDYPDDRPGEVDRYTRARDHLGAWLAEGVVVQDQEPALYVHRHQFWGPDGTPGERLGCFAAVEPVPHERREILRHELTLTAPRQDRVRLLQALGVQTSPVLLLYEGARQVTREMERISEEGRPVAEAVAEGEFGEERHHLWRVVDPQAVEAICSALGATRLYIADGHHRYETALGLGLRGVLALLAPLEDPAPLILPTHRVVPAAQEGLREVVGELEAAGWRVRPQETIEETLTHLQALQSGAHAFAIGDGAQISLVSRDRGRDPGGPAASALDVSVLETEILGPHLGISADGAEAGRVTFERDATAAITEAGRTRGLAFLVNPTTAVEMAAVARAGEAMPQKSTYFVPKVPAGLVLLAEPGLQQHAV